MRKTLPALMLLVAFAGHDAAVAQTQQCEDFASIRKGSYEIVNNIWDRAGYPGKQCITRSGWTWDWPASSQGVRSYPSIRQGWQPWAGGSTTPKLPIQVSKMKNISASFSVTTKQTGSYNTTFEMWIVNSATPTPRSIRTEIMIWTDRSILVPAGSKIDTVTLGGRRYDLWLKEGHQGWRYVAYVAQRKQLSGSIRLDAFVTDGVKRGWIKPDEFVADIEFGNEIVNGKGSTVLNNISFSVQ
jgi:hypothetical protein